MRHLFKHPGTIKNEIQLLNRNPVISELMRVIQGVFAVLDHNRQIVAVNTELLTLAGIPNPEEALGLRLGELMQCQFEPDAPEGCGTGTACQSCGAAIATMASLRTGEKRTEKCSIRAKHTSIGSDIIMEVSTHPISIEKHTFVLLFIQDITAHEQRSVLEKTFFHDMKNHLNGILGGVQLLSQQMHTNEIANIIRQSSENLLAEFEVQKLLMEKSRSFYTAKKELIHLSQLFTQLHNTYAAHSLAKKRNLRFDTPEKDLSFYSDYFLLQRVVSNMIINALEGTKEEQTVRVTATHSKTEVEISVWNETPIPEAIQPRIFTSRFSTKEGDGRGLGTYSMKLFGEEILKGTVSFTSSAHEGTTFRIRLKTHPPTDATEEV
ncbi:PAS domain-containing sensor histidine kinase [Chitinivibrio alkaliphilus]|uniref:Histidine kinase n=1 Tax=Chitinivibrio alkaliphilus ACht1 TaxID=1313304 RepID=U7DAH0_9BACT|nr:PAS domain-containing sensor histidine kinase [Chitinivibrio alkaliphilus]ERP39027.1 histidine kinase [Chitinivibrio alkaliphilus ACht1]